MMKENLAESSHDLDLENILEDAAKKNNLTTFNVKNILKCLIADENVKTYLKKHLSDSPTNEKSKEEKIGKLKYIIPDFYPKYTRSKVKDLKKSGNISSSIWPVLSPILANKPLADINYDAETIKMFETPLKTGSGYSNNDHNGLKFGDIEFPSDDDDEDFTIEKEIEKNIISPSFDSSLFKTDMLLDMIENGRNMADPQSTTSKTVLVTNQNNSFFTMNLDSQSDLYDDYDGDENELLNANIEDMANEIEYLKWVDACLSKPPQENNINTQSLEISQDKRLEFELCNSNFDDGIVSQYRQQNSVKNFDSTLIDSGLQKDKEMEDETETEIDDDPEYDLMGELENFVEDPEDLRDDRAVHVSRKELNDLLNELFDDDGNHISQHTARTSPTLRNNRRNNKNFNSSNNNNKLKPKISDPTYKFTVDENSLNNLDKNKNYLVENDREQYNIETILQHFTAQQIGTLNTQMQQHIQLLMQTYLLGCEHQSLYPIKEMSRILIKELGTFFTSLSGKNSFQSFENNCNLQFCNLTLALNLIASDCERVCRDRHYFAYYDRAADTLVFHNNGNFNETLISQETMYEMANCTGLLYPILLPHRGFKRNKFDVTFEQSNNEENIVVSGPKHGGKYFKRVKHNIFDIVKWEKEKPDFKDLKLVHKSTTSNKSDNNRINLSPSFLPSESRLLALGISYFLTNNSSPFDYSSNKFCKILQSYPMLNQIWQNLQSVFNNANNNKTGECVEKTQIANELNRFLTTNLNWKNVFQAISMHLMPCKTLRSLVNKAVRDIEIIILIKDKCCTKMDNIVEGESINTENTEEQTIKSLMQTLDNNVFCELCKIFSNETSKISDSLEQLRLYSGQLCLVDKNTDQDSKNIESYVTPLKFLLESDDSFDIVYDYHQNLNENSTIYNCNVKEILIGMKTRLPKWLTQFAAIYRANQESFDSMFEELRFNEQCRKKALRSSSLNHLRGKAKTPLNIMRNLLIHSHSTRPFKRTVYLSALKIRKKYRKLLTWNEKKKNQNTKVVKFTPNINLGENAKQQLTFETQNKEKALNKKLDSCKSPQIVNDKIFANKRFLRTRKSTLHHKKSSQNTLKTSNEPNALKNNIDNDPTRKNDSNTLPNEVSKTHSMDCENVLKDGKTTALSKVNSPIKSAVTSLKLKKFVRTSLEHTIDLLHKSSRVDIMTEESGYALADYFLKMAKKALDSSTYQQMLQIITSNSNLIRCNYSDNDESDLAYYMLYENMEKLIGKDKPELFALFTLFLPFHVMSTLMSAKKLFAKQKNVLTFHRIHAFLSLVKVYISKSPSLYHRKFVRRIEQWRLSCGTLKELYQILAFTCRQNTFLLHRLDSVFYGMDIHTESYVALEKGYGFQCIDLTTTINEQTENCDNTIPGGVLQEFSDSNNYICVNGKIMSLDTFETIPYIIGPAPAPTMNNNKSSNLQTTIIKRQQNILKAQHQPPKKRKGQKNRKTVSNDLNTIICTNQLSVNNNNNKNNTLINSKSNNILNKNSTSIKTTEVENIIDLETFINIHPKRSETIQSIPKNVNDNQLIESTTPEASDKCHTTPSKQINVWSKDMDIILIKGLQREQALNQTLTQINDFLQANYSNKNNGDLHTSKITIQDLKDRIETLNQLYNKFNQKP